MCADEQDQLGKLYETFSGDIGSVVQVGFQLVAAHSVDKAPNAWGTKLIAVNPTGLPMDVTTITAGNTAVELLLLMGAVREDQDLAALPWGEEVEVREECKQWCAIYFCVLICFWFYWYCAHCNCISAHCIFVVLFGGFNCRCKVLCLCQYEGFLSMCFSPYVPGKEVHFLWFCLGVFTVDVEFYVFLNMNDFCLRVFQLIYLDNVCRAAQRYACFFLVLQLTRHLCCAHPRCSIVSF